MGYRNYDGDRDIPRTGWDGIRIAYAIVHGKTLIVDDGKNVWARSEWRLEWIGELEKSEPDGARPNGPGNKN